MKRRPNSILIYIVVVFFFANSVCLAGQVVRPETREWAKQMLEQEKSLKAVTDPNAIGVLYYPNKTGDPRLDPLEKGLAIMLITDLSKLKRFKVVERIKLQALMDELKLGASELMDTNTTPRMGRLLGARFLSAGNIWTGSAADLLIDPQLSDIPEWRTIQQPTAEGDLSDLISMEKEILFEMIETLEVELTK